jgi:hypothetical protein
LIRLLSRITVKPSRLVCKGFGVIIGEAFVGMG